MQRRNMLLEGSGVDSTYGSYTRAGNLTTPAPASGTEIRRQWILLLGAVIGVILLAFDQIVN